MELTALSILIIGLFLAAFAVFFIGQVVSRLTAGKIQISGWLAVLVLMAAFIPFGYAYLDFRAGQPPQMHYGLVRLEMDGIGLLVSATVLGLSLLTAIYSIDYLKGEENQPIFFAMLLGMTAAMIGLSCARDLFNLWVWFEAMTLTSLMLVVFYRHQAGSLEAGIKYLIQSAVGSILILLGTAIIYSYGDTLDLLELRPLMREGGSLVGAAGVLLIIGYGVKASLVPMHTWLPDAHSQAPSGVSALLSGVVIECGLVAMLRALSTLTEASPAWGPLLLAFGALNMLVGNLMALRQQEVKRLLAYSSVAQMGYMLVGFGFAAAYGLIDGASGAFFHLFNHAAMKGLAFLAAGVMLAGIHLRNHQHGPLVLSDLNGGARKFPFAAFVFSVAVLGLGGLPPVSGFMSKWQIMVAGATVRSTPALWLVIFMALNSVLSLAYYAPLVNRLYRREASETVLNAKPVSLWMALPLAILLILVVIPGFWPQGLAWFTDQASLSLLTGMGFR